MCYLVGIDVGTSSIKVIAYDLNNKTKIIYSEKVTLKSPKPNWAEQDMWEIWNKTSQLLRKLTKNVKAEDILSVGLSGQSGGLWLVDKYHNPVRMGITWLDLRASELLKNFDEEKRSEYYNTCYRRVSPGGGIFLLKWIEKYEPKNFKKIKYILRCKDWIKLRLTNEPCSDPTDMGGFIDLTTNKYSTNILHIVGMEENVVDILPPLINAWEVAGEVTREASKKTGIKAGTPVVSGAYDVCSSALGAGIIKHSQFFVILGTAGIYAATSKNIIEDTKRNISITPHCIPNMYILNSQSMLATPNLEWFIDEFCKDLKFQAKEKGESVYAICDKIVNKVEPGLVIFHPFLQGEIGPFINPNARGMFFGLSKWHKREHLLRAIYEGVGYSMLDNLIQLSTLLRSKVDEVTVIGGGARSKTWLEILSDISGARLLVPDGEEFGCIGAVINAGVGVRVFKDHKEGVKHFFKLKLRIKPRNENVRRYRKIFKIYQKIYKNVWNLWDEFSKVITN